MSALTTDCLPKLKYFLSLGLTSTIDSPGRTGFLLRVTLAAIAVAAFPHLSPADTYPLVFEPPYDDSDTWTHDIGAWGSAKATAAANFNSGALGINCSAWIGGCTAEAWQIIQFYVPVDSSVKAKVRIRHSGDAERFCLSAASSTAWQWKLDNRPAHRTDIDPAFDWEYVLESIIDIGFLLTGTYLGAAGDVIEVMMDIADAALLADAFTQAVNGGEATELTGTFNFTAKAGYHNLGVGIRGEASGVVLGAGFAIVAARLDSVELTVSNDYGGKPDLVIQDVEIPKERPQRGDTCCLSTGIMNIGTAPAHMIKYSFLLWEPGASGWTWLVRNQGEAACFMPHTTIYRSPRFTFNQKGWYDLSPEVDPSGEVSESDESNNVLAKLVYVIGLPPNKPAKPTLSGGATLYRNNRYTITTSATDPDDDGLNYRFRIRRDGTSSWITPGWSRDKQGWQYAGQVSFIPDANTISQPGTYLVSAQAIDSDALVSQWSDETPFYLVYNTAPAKPAIVGLNQRTTADTLCLTASSNDNENDDIYYHFDWERYLPYTLSGPGRYVSASHKFSKAGTYTVQVQAFDGRGGYSPWASHQVTITEYVPPQGTIVVTTDNNDATFKLTDRADFSGVGMHWSTKAEPGNYTITFGNVANYNTPAGYAQYLGEGKSITFDGRYTHKLGQMIQVTTNRSDAFFTVRGSRAAAGQEFEDEGLSANFSNPYAGLYTILFDPVSGYCLPSTHGETMELEEDEVGVFHGRYVLSPVADLKTTTGNTAFAIASEEAVEFDGSASHNPQSDLGIAKYRFDFGDGTIYKETADDAADGAYDGKTWHVYTERETYRPSLTVYDPFGNPGAESGTVLVKVRPTAATSLKPTPAIAGETLDFEGWGSDLDGDAIVAYEWESSMEGLLSSEASFETNRLTPAVHTIRLRVQDSDSLWSDWASEPLDVMEPLNWPMFKKNEPRLSSQWTYWGRLNGRLSYATDWTYPTAAASLVGSAVAANIDGDWTNGLEIAFATTWGTLEVIDSAGNQLWSANIGAGNSTPAVDDIDGDGSRDVVVGSNNGVYAFDANGNGIYIFNAPIAGRGFSSAPVLADVDWNPVNGKETVIGGQDGRVYALRNNGIPLWVFPCPGGSFYSSAAVAEIEPSRAGLETVIGGMDGTLYVIDSMGVQITSFSTPWPPGLPKPPISTTAAIADLDPNASGPEIVFGSDDGHLYCLTYHGFTLGLAWTYPAPGRPALLPIGSSPAIGFVGEAASAGHVVFGCDNGTVYVLQGHNGACIGTFNCGPGVVVRSTPAIANIDTINNLHPKFGDLAEVIFGATNGNLYAVSFAGGAGVNLPWSPINIGGAAPVFCSPAVADIDHDPDLEILVGAGNVLHALKGARSAALFPRAEFAADPLDGNAPLAVTFTDQSENSPVLWSWDFGDRCFSSAQNPQHTYKYPGTYTVSLTAANAHGQNTITKDSFITVNAVPVAAFTLSAADGNVPLTVTFTDESLNEPATWSWAFGDGGTSTQANPSHTYTEPGVYSVSLAVTNAHGSDTVTDANCVFAQAPIPKADFRQDGTGGKVPFRVNFTDLSSGAPTAWLWNFGDGVGETVRNPSHTYTKPGSYRVSLTVSNSRGADTKTNPVLITVSPQTASVMIPNVPDNSQPPSQTLASTLVGNFSAPLAAANITEYWDCVIKSSNAVYVNAALPGPTAAEYIGHFMDTNNAGSADRGNDSDNHKGTYAKDIRPALFEYIRWDSRHPYDAPPRLPPPLPEQKKGYRWELDTDYTSGWDLYKAHIDAAGPPLLVFRYWNLGATGITLVNVETAEEIVIFLWGGPVAKSTDGTPGSPGEQWNLLAGEAAIGHAVTGVGYIENWDPDGPGTMPAANYAIVHDNWGVTPKNVAIPWQNRIALVTVRVPACKVWFEDLVSFAADWLKTGTGLAGDLNGNKVVDFSDYGALASLWLDCCPDDWPLR